MNDIKRAFLAGHDYKARNPNLPKNSAYIKWVEHVSKYEHHSSSDAAMMFTFDNQTVFYKVSGDTAILTRLPHGHFGFVYHGSSNKRARFLSDDSLASIDAACNTQLSNGTEREVFVTDATLEEILAFKP